MLARLQTLFILFVDVYVCCSVTKLCPTLCNPMGYGTPCLPVPHPSPRVCPSSCPLNQWCHRTISSSVAFFSFCLQCFPASGSFLMSQLFASGDRTVGASASVLAMNVQGWFPLGLTGLISMGLSRVFCSTTIWKHQFFSAQSSLWSLTSIHDY